MNGIGFFFIECALEITLEIPKCLKKFQIYIRAFSDETFGYALLDKMLKNSLKTFLACKI